MATFTTIADTVLEPGKPIRSVDTLALRDNPIAIAEGATGAPKVVTEALATHERMTTANVLAANAGATANEIGTYAFAIRITVTENSVNSTLAGSNLRFASGRSHNITDIGIRNGPVGGALTGTWRCMSQISFYPTGIGQGESVNTINAALWLRIA